MDNAHNTVRQFTLAGHTLEEGLEWMSQELRKILGNSVSLSLPRFSGFPGHAVADGAAFTVEGAMAELSRYYSNANTLLVDISKGTVPVRVWPHHFDIAVLLPGLRGDQSVGVGLSPGDTGYPEPY